MKAQVLLNVPINDAVGEWRIITGPMEIGRARAFQRLCEAMKLSDAIATSEGGGGVVGALSIDRRPVVVVTQGVGELFGDQDHPYAWEQKYEGQRGRRNQFNLAYCFPPDVREIPDIEEIQRRARTDARRLIEAAYQRVKDTGTSTLAPEVVEFEVQEARHLGEWATVADALRRGRSFVPFIDTGAEIEHLEFEPSASQRRHAHSNHRAEPSELYKKKRPIHPPDHRLAGENRKIAFLKVAGTTAGCALIFHGSLLLWNNWSTSPTRLGSSSNVYSSRRGIESSRADGATNRKQYMIPMLEITSGIAMVLGSLIARGRNK